MKLENNYELSLRFSSYYNSHIFNGYSAQHFWLTEINSSLLGEQITKLRQLSKKPSNKETFLFAEGSYEPDPDVLKLQRLLEVKNLLVNEYAGEMRAKVNAMAG